MSESVNFPVTVDVVDHPMAQVRLSTLRSTSATNAAFRASLDELASMLIYEASRDIATDIVGVETPVAPTLGRQLAVQPLVVPVLRAGLGMAQAAMRMFPDGQMGFVGLARDEETHLPGTYLESLPSDLSDRPIFVLDPMLATGGSANQCCAALIQRGATDITLVCVLAAPEGLEALSVNCPKFRVVTASVDEKLNESAYIVPGLGDAGDRQFGAV